MTTPTTLVGTKVLYLMDTMSSKSDDKIVAIPVKCDWATPMKADLENLAGNFLGVALVVAGIIIVLGLGALAVGFATKFRNVLFVAVIGAIIMTSIVTSGADFVVSKC